MFKYIIILLTLLGCARSGEPNAVAQLPLLQQLAEKSALYEQLIPLHRAGPDGFIEWRACDSTLVSGLYGAGNASVNLLGARAADGSWRRRSTKLVDCWYSTAEEREAAGLGGSRSSFSRDMGVGVLWWMWRHRALDEAVELMEYLRANDYQMGQGDPSTTSWSFSNLVPILADMIYEMSNGREKYTERWLPKTFPSGHDSYEAHLQVWLILLDAEINSGITSTQIDRLTEHRNRRPENPLYQAAYAKYVTGDFSPALSILLNPLLYPDNQLPDKSNFCKEWPISSDDFDAWTPCPDKEHGEGPTGADLVAIYNLVFAGAK